jgi:diamine N-acetyltransferase
MKLPTKPQEINYISGDAGLLDEVRVLWEQLNQHHMNLSPYFKDCYRNMRFEDRKRGILQNADCGEVHVDLAIDNVTNERVGFCVTTIDRWHKGLIESIFVGVGYRNLGVGKVLMKAALSWLDSKGVRKRAVSVSVGNEQVFVFYSQFGFKPRRTVLEQV